MEELPDATTALKRYRLTVRGRVQGVGFRPAFYRAFTERGCAGSIRNTPQGVVIEAEAAEDVLRALVREFRALAPPRARVDELLVEQAEPTGEAGFHILPSSADGRSLLPIPPDLALCDECEGELHAVDDRRHRYPFNTCTGCGPRFSIARQVPFDRATNTMEEFSPCEKCAAEFSDPADRRMHAQTLSCPSCGPSLSFLTPKGKELDRPLERTSQMLQEGRILAIKGIGGFHLSCDATRGDVVAVLRERKRRPAKPFAIMVPDLSACERVCSATDFEKELLRSPQAPIVLLQKRDDSPVADEVAPGLAHLGVMLPYTPLHRMLFERDGMPPALVMTSCNRRDEPIAITHEHVMEELGEVVDGILTNNRRIMNRCDDSVVAVLGSRPLPIRRARGYVPEPIMLADGGPPVLATGGMLKNTFALSSGRRVFLSQHIGDVSDADNAAHFVRAFEDFSRLLRLEPEAVVCDMHPDYPTTEFARELTRARGLPLLQVQHHHAHIVSCMAENGQTDPVIGVSWDGSGYGADEAVWGGEFLIADRCDYERRFHLQYVPLPGGEQAVWNPCRMAVAHIARALGPEEALNRLAPTMRDGECELILRIMDKRRFSPLTSSAGRLFDAVAALLGVRLRSTYEGQAACELEARCVAGPAEVYEFGYDGDSILPGKMFRGICTDLDDGEEAGRIATKFHNTMVRIIVETCLRMRDEGGIGTVAMSGGVMQNRTLLAAAVPALKAEGFRVLSQTLVPANDGGLCLGQAACALARSDSPRRTRRTRRTTEN